MDRQANLELNQKEMGAGLKALESRPTNLTIGVTERCNMRCVMCFRNNFRGGIHRDVDDGVLDSLSDCLPYLDSCMWSNDGEIFSARNLDKVFMLARQVPLSARNGFITNGMKLYEFAERVIESGFSEIVVSIDAVDPEIYRKIRRGGEIDRVVSGIRKVRRIASEAGRQIEIRFAFVAMKLNLKELPKLVDLAADLGASSIQVLPLNVNATRGLNELSLESCKELEKRDVQEACRRASETGVRLKHPLLEEYVSIPTDAVQPGTGGDGIECERKIPEPVIERRMMCRVPWTSMFVYVNGNVRVSCNNSKIAGNLNHQSLREIWNGPVYQEVREKLYVNDFSCGCNERYCGYIIRYKKAQERSARVAV